MKNSHLSDCPSRHLTMVPHVYGSFKYPSTAKHSKTTNKTLRIDADIPEMLHISIKEEEMRQQFQHPTHTTPRQNKLINYTHQNKPKTHTTTQYYYIHEQKNIQTNQLKTIQHSSFHAYTKSTFHTTLHTSILT